MSQFKPACPTCRAAPGFKTIEELPINKEVLKIIEEIKKIEERSKYKCKLHKASDGALHCLDCKHLICLDCHAESHNGHRVLTRAVNDQRESVSKELEKVISENDKSKSQIGTAL